MLLFDEVRVLNDDGWDVVFGEIGYLFICGFYMICGYYKVFEYNVRFFIVDGFY